MAAPSLFHLTSEEKKSALDRLVEGASPAKDFYLLLILSTIITTLGVLENSATIVIGGMLVAPIISPVLSLAMSVVMADFRLLRQSAQTLGFSIALVLVIALVISLVSLEVRPNGEILSRTVPSLVFFLVALAAGVAAAFAFSKPSLNVSIPGIAVTVALLPPLVVVPLGITLGELEIFLGALGVFFLNLLGIIFAATIVFSLMRFYALRTEAVKKLEKEIEKKE